VSEEGTPVVEMRDVGLYYWRQTQKRTTLKDAFLNWRWGQRPKLLWALRHLDLTCYEGQTLGIVGPNGAGKSTLCLVLSNILTPDEGEIAVRGKVSTLVTLGSGFNPDLTGRSNIHLYAAFLGIPRREIDRNIEAIIEFSELGDFIDDPMRHYSSGMRARLGFSVATTLNPEILVLDEVFAVGDQRFRIKSQKRIQEMMSRSRLIVIVSHSTPFLREMCTNCLWMENGTVREYGEASVILDAYDRFMGAPRRLLDTE